MSGGIIAFYLGGLIATAVIFAAQAMDDGSSIDLADSLAVLLWPVTSVAYALAAAKARWP